MRINHNIPALRALHQLSKSNSTLDKSLERLSSGLRINHAADDAAGLAITQKMDTQVRGLQQANRNAMDGISLIQTAEGALNEVHSMLQRIRELSVQVSNGTYDSTDRKAVQDEVNQLQNEIQRISESIEFNEMKLLNGDVDRRAFSDDSEIAEIVSMSDTVEAGTYTFTVSQKAGKTMDIGGRVGLFDATGATVGGTLNINGEQIDIEAGQTSEEVFSAIRDLCSKVNIDVTVMPSAPFDNGKALKFQMDQYGNQEIKVTGDISVLNALGLDSSHFMPNTDHVYSVVSDIGTAPNTWANAGNVMINGTNVAIGAGDDTDENLFTVLDNANIPGIELSYDSTGSIQVISSKPISVQPVDDADADDVNLASVLDTAFNAASSISPTSGNTISKSVPTDGISTDAGAGNEITGDFDVLIDGSVAVSVDLSTLAGNPFDLDDATSRSSFVQQVNNLLSGDNTFFAFSNDSPAKFVAYNTDGKEVTIQPTTSGSADTTTVSNLGYSDSTVTVETKFGNIGKDVQVDLNSIVYDDTSTVEVDGFPLGTTVSTNGNDIVFEGNNSFELRLSSGGSVGEVTLNLLETGPLDLQIGANEGQFMEIRIQNLAPRALGITNINLSTTEGAQEAITTVDDAINMISSVRSKLGAYQNRLEHTIANLETASENMTASLSRILDADMAEEMSKYTQQNVISQAGTSMLAQANQRPQSILQLLQN